MLGSDFVDGVQEFAPWAADACMAEAEKRVALLCGRFRFPTPQGPPSSGGTPTQRPTWRTETTGSLGSSGPARRGPPRTSNMPRAMEGIPLATPTLATASLAASLDLTFLPTQAAGDCAIDVVAYWDGV